MTNTEVKKYLQSITSLSKFKETLEDIKLNDNERLMLDLFYVKEKPLDYIADELGFAYSYTRKLHMRVLHKIGTFLEQN